MLGICYGMQLMAHQLGGASRRATSANTATRKLEITGDSPLFAKMDSRQKVWMSHGDKLTKLPDGFSSVAHSQNSPYAAIANPQRRLFGLQFHPEVDHTPRGQADHFEFRPRHLRLRPQLDDEVVYRPGRRGNSRDGRQRPRDSRLERRRGFQRRGGAASQGHRRSAHLHLRQQRPAAQVARRKACSTFSARNFHIKLQYEDATETVPAQAARA